MSRAGSAPPLWEAGAQAERTGLSWTRTTATAGAVLLLLARAGGGTLGVLVLSTGMVVTGCLVLLASARYRTTVRRLAERRALPGPGPLLALAVVVALTGCAALVILAGGVAPGTS